MVNLVKTPCIRCGKIRIFGKTWKEKFEGRGQIMTFVTMVCPDIDCQKLVDADFAQKRERRLEAENRKRHNIKIKPAA